MFDGLEKYVDKLNTMLDASVYSRPSLELMVEWCGHTTIVESANESLNEDLKII